MRFANEMMKNGNLLTAVHFVKHIKNGGQDDVAFGRTIK